MVNNWVSLVMGVILILAGVGLGYGAFDGFVNHEPQYDYEYTIKAEQVNENEMVDGVNGTDVSDLPKEQQEALYEAFKKSDHFLGGAEAYVRLDDQIETTDTWRIIRIRGVPMLVGITYEGKIAGGLGSPASIVMMTLLSLLVTVLGLIGVVEGR